MLKLRGFSFSPRELLKNSEQIGLKVGGVFLFYHLFLINFPFKCGSRMSFVWFCFLLCIERLSCVCFHTCLKRRFVHSILGTKFCIWMYVLDWACLLDYLNFYILFLLSGKRVGLRESSVDIPHKYCEYVIFLCMSCYIYQNCDRGSMTDIYSWWIAPFQQYKICFPPLMLCLNYVWFQSCYMFSWYSIPLLPTFLHHFLLQLILKQHIAIFITYFPPFSLFCFWNSF